MYGYVRQKISRHEHLDRSHLYFYRSGDRLSLFFRSDQRKDIEKDQRFTLGQYGYYGFEDCGFVFQLDGQDALVNQNGVFALSPDDTQHLKLIDELLASSSVHPYNIHEDELRTFHVLFLLQSDPLIVWGLHVSSADYES